MKKLLLLLLSVFTILSCENRAINDKINQKPPSVTDQHSPKVYFPVNKDYVEKRVNTLLSTIKEILEPILTASENEVLSSLKYEYEEEKREYAKAFEYNEDKHVFVVNLPSLNFTLESKTEECRDEYIDYLMVSRFLQICMDKPHYFYTSLHQFLVPELEKTNTLGKKEIYNCKLFNDFERTNESFLLGLFLAKARNNKPYSMSSSIPTLLGEINHIGPYRHRCYRNHSMRDRKNQIGDNPYSMMSFSKEFPKSNVGKERDNIIYLGIHFGSTLSNKNVNNSDYYKAASQAFQKFLYFNSEDLNKDLEKGISYLSQISPLNYNLKDIDKSRMNTFNQYKLAKEILEEKIIPEFTVEKINKNYDICRNQEILSKAYEKGLKYKNILENALKIDADRAPIKLRLEAEIHYLNTAYVQKMGTYEEAFSNLEEGTPYPNFHKYNDINTAKKSICIRFHEDKIKKPDIGQGSYSGEQSSENRNIYLFRMDLTKGKIIGEHVYNKSNPKAARLSTALYCAYKKAFDGFSGTKYPLRTVESFNVSNDESKTVMDIISESHRLDRNPEDEIEFDAESIEAIALLGTPNLKSCYWLAHDFMDEMGRKKPKKVKIRCSKDSETSPSLFHTDLVVDFE